MVGQLNLQPGEGVLLRTSSVQIGMRVAFSMHDLVLTNERLVAIKEGTMGGVKGQISYPLDQINIYNGRVQALASSPPYRPHVLDVYFVDQHVQFVFLPGASPDPYVWSQAIHEAVTGERLPLEEAPKPVETSDPVVAAFKSALGHLRSPKAPPTSAASPSRNVAAPSPPPPPRVIAAKCLGCAAPLSGMQGTVVTCDYCLSNHTL